MADLRHCAKCTCTGIAHNPVTVRMLGLCPLLAVSNTTSKALVLGLLFAAVVLVAAAVVALLRHTVSWRLKPMYYALVGSFVTTAVISEAAILDYAAVAALGIYPALIASNCFILSFMQEIAERNALTVTLRRGLRDVASIVIFLVLFAALRELIAHGTLSIFVSADMVPAGPLPLIASAPGALLTLALVLAAANALSVEPQIRPQPSARSGHRADPVGTPGS